MMDKILRLIGLKKKKDEPAVPYTQLKPILSQKPVTVQKTRYELEGLHLGGSFKKAKDVVHLRGEIARHKDANFALKRKIDELNNDLFLHRIGHIKIPLNIKTDVKIRNGKMYLNQVISTDGGKRFSTFDIEEVFDVDEISEDASVENLLVPCCKICTNKMERDWMNPPLVLSCGHTLCLNCSKKIIEGQRSMKCPFCRRVTQTDRRGVYGLPWNFDLLEVIEAITNAKIVD